MQIERMMDIKANTFFWVCKDGQCTQYKAFGDAHYEDPDICVLYAMDVQTQAMRKFLSLELPEMYDEDQYGD